MPSDSRGRSSTTFFSRSSRTSTFSATSTERRGSRSHGKVRRRDRKHRAHLLGGRSLERREDTVRRERGLHPAGGKRDPSIPGFSESREGGPARPPGCSPRVGSKRG